MGEDVYLNILEALRDFFSPSPKFYTLPQLLDKGKTIEEIFAGRPYDLKESYGFVDTNEFEQITLRKKMHLSDVYHILFDIDGVKNVRNLAWKLCNNPGTQPVLLINGNCIFLKISSLNLMSAAPGFNFSNME